MSIKNHNETTTCPALSTLSKPIVSSMAGQNNGGFENRVTQETGAH